MIYFFNEFNDKEQARETLKSFKAYIGLIRRMSSRPIPFMSDVGFPSDVRKAVELLGTEEAFAILGV